MNDYWAECRMARMPNGVGTVSNPGIPNPGMPDVFPILKSWD